MSDFIVSEYGGKDIQKVQMSLSKKLSLVLEKFQKGKHIFVFGGGLYAAYMEEYLKKKQIVPSGFVVSSLKNQKSRIKSKLCEIWGIYYPRQDCTIILALNSKYHKKVIPLLEMIGFSDVIFLTDEELRLFRIKIDSEILVGLVNEDIPKQLGQEKEGMNILIVRTDGIGDLVMTTSLIRELRRAYPLAHVVLITSPESYELFETCPYISEVIVYNWRQTIQYTLREKIVHARTFVAEKLSGRHYDWAIVPRWDEDRFNSSLIAYFSGADRRIAHSEKVCLGKAVCNKNYDVLFTDILYDYTLRHEVLRNLSVLSYMNIMICDKQLELWETEEDRMKLRRILHEAGYTQNVIALGISASAELKKWALENYIELAKELRCRHMNPVFVGGIEDKEASSYAEVKSGELNLVGKLSLREIIALMRNAIFYIGNDTGIMHIASACGTCVVEISSHPQGADDNDGYSIVRNGPYGTRFVALQPPGIQPDINLITPAMVLRHVDELMKDMCTI